MEQVYRFKVALKLQRRLWRLIEAKGSQTLGDLDRIIREAFKYDVDHLSDECVMKGHEDHYAEEMLY